MNYVDVTNYKGSKGFGDKEHEWSKNALKDINSKAYRSYREKEIDYFAEFKSSTDAAKALRLRRLQSTSYATVGAMNAAICGVDPNKF